ncbi:MAG: glycosyltransferase [Desulfobaccales bacterium]
MTALQEMGYTVVAVDTTPPEPRQVRRLFSRIIRRLGYSPDLAGVNRQIIDLISRSSFDILWIDKGLTILPLTLTAVKKLYPECRMISYSPDDMLNTQNQSPHYLACLSLYDLHVTTKSYNVNELKELGAQNVLFNKSGFNPLTHRPINLTAKDKYQLGSNIGFIGAFEQDRYLMMRVASQAGFKITVRGPGWNSYIRKIDNLTIKPGWIFEEDYAKAICATKINLAFLRKANRDLHTTRSLEIPACAAFMLAERTEEHLELFEEGKEAEFFGSEEELTDKIKYYLAHSEECVRIGFAGRERCIRSGYSNHDRLKEVIHFIRHL